MTGLHLRQIRTRDKSMATILFPSPIFGPIKSRRLGISLGINLLPGDGKVCTFDCIYCECGFNSEHRPKSRFPSREEVRNSLEAKLREMCEENILPDVITFAGNGEPTLHPNFSEIIDDTLRLRNHYCPCAKVSVLSNATTIIKPNVFSALEMVDNNILKLDTVNASYIERLDRPVCKYNLEAIISQMERFKGKVIVQTMFLKGNVNGFDFNNTCEEFVRPWIEAVKRIAPREVMIYTIDRETPQKGLEKATPEELDNIVTLLTKEGIKASAAY